MAAFRLLIFSVPPPQAVWEHFCPSPERHPILFGSHSPSPPLLQPWTNSNLLSASTYLPTGHTACEQNDTIRDLLGLASLTYCFQDSSPLEHVLRTSFLLTAEEYSIIWIYHIRFIHSSYNERYVWVELCPPLPRPPGKHWSPYPQSLRMWPDPGKEC